MADGVWCVHCVEGSGDEALLVPLTRTSGANNKVIDVEMEKIFSLSDSGDAADMDDSLNASGASGANIAGALGAQD